MSVRTNAPRRCQSNPGVFGDPSISLTGALHEQYRADDSDAVQLTYRLSDVPKEKVSAMCSKMLQTDVGC
jgi:hypothetical protein